MTLDRNHPPPRRSGLRAATLAGVGLAALATCAGGYALARPVPATVGPPPPDLGARPVLIPSGSGSTLRGWFAPGRPGGGAVLLMHGVRSDRRSMLGRARLLRGAGYGVLLVDLQAHGESPGRHITFGALESLDAHAALAALRRWAPGERVGVIGVSLGGAAALLGPGPLPADAMVLESVYPTIEEATADRLRIRLGPLGPPLAPLLTWQLRAQVGVSPAELRPVDAIRRLRAPVLVVAGAADRHTTLAESRHLYAAAPEPKSLWIVDGAAHQDLYAFDPAGYGSHVLDFLDAHLRPAR